MKAQLNVRHPDFLTPDLVAQANDNYAALAYARSNLLHAEADAAAIERTVARIALTANAVQSIDPASQKLIGRIILKQTL